MRPSMRKPGSCLCIKYTHSHYSTNLAFCISYSIIHFDYQLSTQIINYHQLKSGATM